SISLSRRDRERAGGVARVGELDRAAEPSFERGESGGGGTAQGGRDGGGSHEAPLPGRIGAGFAQQRLERGEGETQGRVAELGRQRRRAIGPHDLDMAEPGPAQHLRFRRIGGEGGGERPGYALAGAAALQPDEIDDDAAAEI